MADESRSPRSRFRPGFDWYPDNGGRSLPFKSPLKYDLMYAHSGTRRGKTGSLRAICHVARISVVKNRTRKGTAVRFVFV